MARSPRPRKGESIRGYARRTGVSYRQARRTVAGKVYETDYPRDRTFGTFTHGASRAERRKVRTDFWLDRWKAEFPQDKRSDAAIVRYWRESGFQLPRVGTHGTTRPTEAERARMNAFLEEFGLSYERRQHYLSNYGTRGSDPSFTVDEDTGQG